MLKREKKRGQSGKMSKKEDEELFVFGYASKLFRDDKVAQSHDKERHLMSWQGDNSLQIDRYDCRLLFTDRSQFESYPEAFEYSLTAEEQHLEQLCDEERYLELTTNMEEYNIEQEEEMKRFKEAISKDSGYSAVGFSYGDNGENDSNDDNYSSNQVQGPEPEPFVRFVAPEELEVPDGMEIPDTDKMNAIIEKTAVFVSQQGTQMEILVKAKQAGNPQFDFLNFDNWLNPYYKHVLKRIQQKLYTPQLQAVSSPKPEETKESEPDTDDDSDSDGEFELHPLLTASHRSVSNSPCSSLPSSPTPQTIGQHHAEYNTNQSDNSYYGDANYEVYQWNKHEQAGYYDTNEYASEPVSSQYHLPVQSSTHTSLSAMNLLPPPPPPPGEDEWPGTKSSQTEQTSLQSVYSQPTAIDPRSVITTGYPTMIQLPIVPPPPDIQPIIDKLANYVAKNGPDFENIIKAKDDPRFTFVHPWNEHHKYYQYKKQLCIDEIEEERRAAAAKGPISFSIKPKEVQKPKIEYRTNVIYKQSIETGECEDEDLTTIIDTQDNTNSKETELIDGKEMEEQETKQDERTQEDIEEQMKSIQAAKEEVLRLEAESQFQREKQLQEERRRKASLFISMLKKTKVPEGSNQESEQMGQVKRKFTERKRPSDTKVDMFEDKRPRNDDDVASGVGAPSLDIIRATQDLMAKVKAASRTNR